ncbi:MAG TPA: ABC transporter permease [Chloroflexota bacterium]|jgi:peptide/nickel transport system permease protein
MSQTTASYAVERPHEPIDELDRAVAERSLSAYAWRQFVRHRLAVAGVVVFSFLVLATIVGPMLDPEPTDAIDFAQALQGPSAGHPFGTDDLGRDILARALLGGRVSIAVGVTTMLVAIFLGTLIGAIAGFFGGTTDVVLMRMTDVFLSLPQLPLLLMTIYLFRDPLRASFGPELGIFILIVVLIGAFNWMGLARLVRASFLSVRQREFVIAAEALGVGNGRIIARHILPNVLSPVIVAATLAIGAAIITESALSFLGLGFPPDVPTWGRLLYDAQNFLDLAPHWAIFPGLLIFLTVLSVNYVGDGLRDALDPRRAP